MGSGVRRTKWLEQSESQRLETLVIVIRAYSPTTNHPFYGWFVIFCILYEDAFTSHSSLLKMVSYGFLINSG